MLMTTSGPRCTFSKTLVMKQLPVFSNMLRSLLLLVPVLAVHFLTSGLEVALVAGVPNQAAYCTFPVFSLHSTGETLAACLHYLRQNLRLLLIWGSCTSSQSWRYKKWLEVEQPFLVMFLTCVDTGLWVTCIQFLVFLQWQHLHKGCSWSAGEYGCSASNTKSGHELSVTMKHLTQVFMHWSSSARSDCTT